MNCWDCNTEFYLMIEERGKLEFNEWFSKWEGTLKEYAKNPENEFDINQSEALYRDCI